MTLAATMFAGGVSAFDPDDLQKLKDYNDCAECDLEGANLRSAYLSYADLKGAILDYVIMNNAILCNITMPDGSVIYNGCSRV